MSSERAGVHTSGALNREKARPIAYEYLDPYGIDGQPEPHAVRVVEGFLDALEACVEPDPRLAHIEPTDAQVAAFKAAWEAEHDAHRGYIGGPPELKPGDRTRAGLRAVLNMANPDQ